jgi:hypothetical protein
MKADLSQRQMLYVSNPLMTIRNNKYHATSTFSQHENVVKFGSQSPFRLCPEQYRHNKSFSGKHPRYRVFSFSMKPPGINLCRDGRETPISTDRGDT